MRLRSAVADDAEAVAALVNSAYRGDVSRLGWTTEADLLGGQRTDPAMVRGLIVQADSRVELAFLEDQLVGCAHLQQAGSELRVGMLSVRPDRQARGIGKTLLDHAEQLAASAFVAQRVTMAVIQQRRELIAFYQRRGYRVSDRFADFPQDRRYGIPQVDDLRLVWLEKSL